ncbi:MAG: hypothetical protein QM784_01310 [Polyangiaceae bacterium]
MKKSSLVCALASGAATLLLASANASALPVVGTVVTRWLTANAVIGGSNCSKADTGIIAWNGQMSIIFSNMGVNLPAGPNSPKTVASSCSVAVPVVFNRPGWLEVLQQDPIWGWARVGGDTQGQATLRASICGSALATTTDYASGTVVASHVTEQDIAQVNIPTMSCLYVAHIGVAARKLLDSSSISVRIQGEDVELDVWG